MTAVASDTLDRFIDGVTSLPPSPSLMVELLALLRKPDRDIDQLIELMSHDPSLTAEILRQCNTAFFCKGEPATDIFEATFRLGFHEVYRITTALFSSQLLTWPGAAPGGILETIWTHSALTGVLAGALARELGENEGVAFTGGLLHDLGKIVFLQAGGEAYGQAAQNATSSADLRRLEKERFGFDHLQVGSRLLSRWEFPPTIVIPVQHHPHPDQAGEFERSTAILGLADASALNLSLDNTPEGEGGASLSLLQLSPDRLAAITESVQSDAERIGSLFRTQAPVRTPPGRAAAH